MEIQRVKDSESDMKNNKSGGCTLPDIMTYYKKFIKTI